MTESALSRLVTESARECTVTSGDLRAHCQCATSGGRECTVTSGDLERTVSVSRLVTESALSRLVT